MMNFALTANRLLKIQHPETDKIVMICTVISSAPPECIILYIYIYIYVNILREASYRYEHGVDVGVLLVGLCHEDGSECLVWCRQMRTLKLNIR